MKSIKGTKTAKNLMTAFVSETQAAVRYEYYGSQAKKDGYVQIQNIFLETARNEKAHAKRLYKFLKQDLQGEKIEISNDFPVMLGDTLENLKSAAAGENEEHSHMYPEFAKIAKEEGLDEVASVFEHIAIAEKAHDTRYKKLISNIENGKVFKKDGVCIWKCNNCGYLHEGTEAPEVCPACDHPRDHFEVFKETY